MVFANLLYSTIPYSHFSDQITLFTASIQECEPPGNLMCA
jgi:hypothetical protein